MLTYFDTTLWDSTLPSPEYREKFKNKSILLINAGPSLKYLVLKRIKDLWVGKLIVLDKSQGWFSDSVDGIIACDDSFSPLTNPDTPETDTRIQAISSYMKEQGITFDGAWTFADRSVVLCAQIAQFLGKPGIDPLVLAHLKNKQTLREWLFEHAPILSSECPHVSSIPSLDLYHIHEEDFPIILKWVESVGKSLVQVIRSSEEMQKSLKKYDINSITAEPYFEGIDFDLNVIVENGKIVWSWFIENSPTVHSFLENWSITCGCLNNEEQDEVRLYAQNILDQARGIHHACLHIEFRARHDENGFSFTLIEINFRMGGVENFVFHLWQDNQDLILSNLELAFGMSLSQKHIPVKSGPYPFMRTADLYTNKTGILKNLKWPLSRPGVLEYVFFAEVGMDCQYPPRGCIFDEIGWIVTGSSVSQEEANNLLEQARTEMIIDI